MRPEDVPAELVEAAAGVSWEQARFPGWPTWEEFSRRAAEDLWDCRELRDTHLRLTRELLAAVLPLCRSTVLQEAAQAFDIDDLVSGLFMAPGMSVPEGGFRTNEEAQRRVQEWLERQARMATTLTGGNPT